MARTMTKNWFCKCVMALSVVTLPSAILGQRSTQSGQSKRPVVAVADVKDLANTGQGTAFQTMIVTSVASTNRFRVITRNFEAVEKEQARAQKGQVTTNTPGRDGGFEGADFQIEATLTQAQTGQKVSSGCEIGKDGAEVAATAVGGLLGAGISIFGKRSKDCRTSVATVDIDMVVTNQLTGELVASRNIRSDSYGSGKDTIDLVDLFRSAAKEISNELTLSAFPIQIAAIQADGSFLLNYGDGTLNVGDVLTVSGKSDANAGCVRDPGTGECLTSARDTASSIGSLRVTETQPRFSIAVAVNNFAYPPEVGAVVRYAKAQAGGGSKTKNGKGRK